MEFSRAQNNLGLLYLDGLGTKQDYEKAMEWYLKAVSNGHIKTNNNIAYSYQHGLGVEQDYQSTTFDLKAAEDNDPSAIYNIGYLAPKRIGAIADKKKHVNGIKSHMSLGLNPLNLRLIPYEDT
ncbi:tetratricopeptide repeat protein [Proteus vulgaris]|uniref:tetratricopeptide repeat protein n=1 Tax=Proteus vulgaris TaxID=585 RepID=UPI0034DCFE52